MENKLFIHSCIRCNHIGHIALCLLWMHMSRGRGIGFLTKKCLPVTITTHLPHSWQSELTAFMAVRIQNKCQNTEQISIWSIKPLQIPGMHALPPPPHHPPRFHIGSVLDLDNPDLFKVQPFLAWLHIYVIRIIWKYSICLLYYRYLQKAIYNGQTCC